MRNIDRSEMIDWLVEHSVPYQLAEVIATYIVEDEDWIITESKLKEAYSLNEEYGSTVHSNGYIQLASGPDGSHILVDIKEKIGQVSYASMAMCFDEDARDIAVLVAESVEDFVFGIVEIEEYPMDYYDAVEWQKLGKLPIVINRDSEDDTWA